MSENIYAYTGAEYKTYPDYISYNKTDRGMMLTVRGKDCDSCQEVEFPLFRFWQFVDAVTNFNLPAGVSDIEFLPKEFFTKLANQYTEIEKELAATKQNLAGCEASLKLALTRAQCDRKDLEAAQLHIKELQEALRTIAEPESNHPRFNWTGSIHLAYEDIAREALTRQPVTSALEKMLLEAEIKVLEQAFYEARPYGEGFGHMIAERKAKLAELNKEATNGK